MIREGLAASARYVMMSASGTGALRWMLRTKVGGNTTTTNGGTGALPNLWVRFSRTGGN